MEWMILPLKRYADFSGRSRRKEYWMFFLFQIIIQIAFIAIIVGFISVSNDNDPDPILTVTILMVIIWAIFSLATFIPNMAVIVRRCHDQNIPGIVGILLYLGTVIFTLPGLVVLFFMIREGDKGDNQYGSDPKLNENVGDVFR